MSRTLKAHILLVLVTLVWGATFVEIKDALRDISPLLFNAVRMSLAALVLIAIYFRHLKNAMPAAVGQGLFVGCFLCTGYAFQTTGLGLTTPAKSAFLTGLAVVLVPVLLAVFWKRKSTTWQVLGVILALTGLYLLTVPSNSASGFGDWRSVNKGDALTICCAVAFAFHIILLGRATAEHPFEVIAALQTLTAATIMFLAAPLAEHVHVTWSARVIVAILITGLLGTAAAFTIQAWAQQFISPTNTALIFALEPVFAWMTSYIVLHERLGWRGGAGAALILAGLLSSELLGKPERTSVAEASRSLSG